MFRIILRTVSATTPKLYSLQNHQTWFYVRFASIASSSRPEGGNSFTVSYLIDTCGFSPKGAAFISQRVNFKTREKPDSVIQFLKNLGLSQTNALAVIMKCPRLCRAVPEVSFTPKIDFFKSKGLSDSEIRNIVMRGPNLLSRSLENEIIPSFDFFLDMFRSRERLIKVVTRYWGILCDLRLSVSNINAMREEGVPESNILKFVENSPRSLKICAAKFKKALLEVKELGFDPLKVLFITAIHVRICTGRSTWARKEAVYRKWGCTDDELLSAFRVCPWFISVSEDKIEAIMDFLVNKLGYTTSAILSRPVVLSMSLEKRLIPRGSVILVLMARFMMKRFSLRTIFGSTEDVFLQKFVYCYEKEPGELLKLYQEKMALASDKKQILFEPSN